MTDEHIKFCEKVIKNEGRCYSKCKECPFSSFNIIGINSCHQGGYSSMLISPDGIDEKLIKSSKEFLRIANEITRVVMLKDDIKSPNHYKLDGLNIESKDVAFAVIKNIKNSKIATCVFNVLKYVIRAEKKDGLKDYKKAKEYLEWIIAEKEREQE